jgi:hypothetical protein
MTNNNMWDCADMPPMFSAKWNIGEFLVFKCILDDTLLFSE